MGTSWTALQQEEFQSFVVQSHGGRSGKNLLSFIIKVMANEEQHPLCENTVIANRVVATS